MLFKKKGEKKQDQIPEHSFKHMLKRELMKWYCGALYSGRIKLRKRTDRTSCTAKKA